MTSQIFANIYLNELDRAIVHTLRPQAYLRYGDDFTVFVPSRTDAEAVREAVTTFCRGELSLIINPKQDIILPARRGLSFLGVDIYPAGRRLKHRHWERIRTRLALKNVASYGELLLRHNPKSLRWLSWLIREKVLDKF